MNAIIIHGIIIMSDRVAPEKLYRGDAEADEIEFDELPQGTYIIMGRKVNIVH